MLLFSAETVDNSVLGQTPYGCCNKLDEYQTPRSLTTRGVFAVMPLEKYAPFLSTAFGLRLKGKPENNVLKCSNKPGIH